MECSRPWHRQQALNLKHVALTVGHFENERNLFDSLLGQYVKLKKRKIHMRAHRNKNEKLLQPGHSNNCTERSASDHSPRTWQTGTCDYFTYLFLIAASIEREVPTGVGLRLRYYEWGRDAVQHM